MMFVAGSDGVCVCVCVCARVRYTMCIHIAPRHHLGFDVGVSFAFEQQLCQINILLEDGIV